MKPKSKISLEGHVKIYELPPDFTYEQFEALEDKEKYIKNEGKNLAVDSGLQQILLLMIGSNTNSFTTCGVGSGSTGAVSGDIALETSIGTNTINSRYRVGNTVYFNTFFGKNDENGTWNESGIFTTGNVMLCRRVLPSPFTKDTTKSAVISWTITFTATAD